MIMQLLKMSIQKDRLTRHVRRAKKLNADGDFKQEMNKLRKLGSRI